MFKHVFIIFQISYLSNRPSGDLTLLWKSLLQRMVNHRKSSKNWAWSPYLRWKKSAEVALAKGPSGPFVDRRSPLRQVNRAQNLLRQLLLDGSASEPGYSWDLVNLSDLDLGYELNGYLPGLVNVYVTKENYHAIFMGKSTISMAIFNSYVSLPEGHIYEDLYNAGLPNGS